MPASLRTFDALIAGLRGIPCEEAAWPKVLTLANRSLTTTNLAVRLSAVQAALPPDVTSFLDAILERNRQRNARLLDQLAELADAFEDRGILGIAIKGAAVLLQANERTLGERMLSDLDILVAREDFASARDWLLTLGYSALPTSDAQHDVSVLGRPEDAATIDLHGRLVGLGAINPTVGAQIVPIGRRGRLVVPSPTMQTMLLLAHDMVRGQDYIGGLLDLRHALDIDKLSRSREGIDWPSVSAAMPKRLATALRSKQIELNELFGSIIPFCSSTSWRARLQVHRRRLQIACPRLRPVLAIASVAIDPFFLPSRRAFLSKRTLQSIRLASFRKVFAMPITGKL